jgi:predicted transcriptional regulator
MRAGGSAPNLYRRSSEQHGRRQTIMGECGRDRRFGLKPDYPMVAPNYAQEPRELAVKIGLGQQKRPARRR